MFNEFSEKELNEKLEALQRMLQRSNNVAQREGLEKRILHVRSELEFKIANREQRTANKEPKAPASNKTSNPVAVAVPGAPHARRQKIASDARAAADTLLQKLNNALRKAEESKRCEDAVRKDKMATQHDKRAAIDRTLLDEEIAQNIQKKVDIAVAKADNKEADLRKAEAKAAAHRSSLLAADRPLAIQPLTDTQLLPADLFETGEQIPAFPGQTPPQLATQRPLADSQSVQDGALKRRLPTDFDENQRGNPRSRPSPSSPQPHGQAVNPSDDEDVSEFLPNDDDDQPLLHSAYRSQHPACAPRNQDS